jgi:phage terminase large subunit-like protein
VEPLKEVVRVPRRAVLRVLSRVAETAHGLNVSGAIVDEVHTLRLRRAGRGVETGTGARDQPLMVFITTADEAEDGTIYDEKHTYTRNVSLGIVRDPGHLRCDLGR